MCDRACVHVHVRGIANRIIKNLNGGETSHEFKNTLHHRDVGQGEQFLPASQCHVVRITGAAKFHIREITKELQ